MRKHTINYIFAFLLGIVITAVIFYDLELGKEKIIVKEVNEYRILNGRTEIVAVNHLGNGLIGEVNVEIIEGDGKVLINTNPFIEPDTQYSATTAVKVAENFTGIKLDDKNIIFDFDIGLRENETGLIGGPSAGVAMTIAAISAIEGKVPRKSVVVTGAILPNGNIGWVGGVIEKGQASVDLGKTKFLIPKGQAYLRYYEKEIVKRNFGSAVFYSTRYVPKNLDVVNYFNERFLTVKEVSTIEDVAEEVFL